MQGGSRFQAAAAQAQQAKVVSPYQILFDSVSLHMMVLGQSDSG